MRTKPAKKSSASPVNAVLFCGILALLVSYVLGYHLSWDLDGVGMSTAQAAGTPQTPELSQALQAASSAAPSAPEADPVAEAARPASADSASQPPQSRKDWDELTARLKEAASRYSRGHVAIYLKNLKNGETWSYHADDLFPAASLIKVPIMIAVFERIHEGTLSLNQTMILRRYNRVGGSGTLKWRPTGTPLTISELLDHMIRESDNTAANMLIEAVGGIPFIQDQIARLGLVYTGIHRQGMSLRGGYVAHENYTTAREMSLMLDKIYRGEMIDRASSRMMMGYLLLKKPTVNRLAKDLPWGWEIAHKTGLERRACHDAAIVLTPNGDFLLTVLTGHNVAYRTAKKFITQIGRLTYLYYGGQIPRRHRRYYAWARRYRRSRRRL